MDPITYRPVFIVRRDGNNVVLQRDQLADTVDLLSDTYATPWSPYRLAWPVYAQTQSITHVDSPGAAPSTRWDATEGELNIAFAELHSAREVFQAVQNRSALPIVLAQWHEASEQRMGEVAFVASKKWHSRFTPGADEDSDGHGSVSAPTATGAVYDHPLPDDGQHVAMVTEQE